MRAAAIRANAGVRQNGAGDEDAVTVQTPRYSDRTGRPAR